MGEDSKPHYSRIGCSVVLGALALAGILIYIGRLGASKNAFFVETSFNEAVSGLSEGSPVNFRGVKIGEVCGISFVGNVYADCAPSDRAAVLVTMAIDPKRGLFLSDGSEAEALVREQIMRGLRVTVTSSGVTGLSRLELNFPKHPAPAPMVTWKPSRIYIPSDQSLFENLSDTATTVMRQLRGMDFAILYSNLTAMSVSGARLVESVRDMVQNGRGDIENSLANVEAASADLREFANRLKENPSLLLRSQDAEPLPETAK